MCLIVLLAALFLPVLAPVCYGQMPSMRLLTPTTGWVSNDGHLYWTTDSGSKWRNITPIPPGIVRTTAGVKSAYFLNTHEGWAVLYLPWKPIFLVPQPDKLQDTLYDIAHTIDAGRTWSFLPMTYPQLPQWQQEAVAGPSDMFFLDPLHGWLIIAMTGSSNFAPGKLLATDDGGRNWKWVNGPGTVGELLFTSIQNGWLAGGPGGGNLYVTRDGTSSWEHMNLKTVLQGKTVGCGILGLPHFTDERHGYVAASCMGQTVVAFATSDAGRTWKPAKVLRNSWQGGILNVTIADSVLIVPSGSTLKTIHIATVQLKGNLTSSVVVSEKGLYDMTFADRSHGLVYAMKDRLFYTSDGGATWKDVTPWLMPKPSPPPPGVTVTHPKIKMEVTHPRASKSTGDSAHPHKP